MILNVTLGIAFLGSGFTLWYLISKRIPELVAIPDEVIAKRLEEDSARVRVFLLQFKTFYTEGRIKEFFWSIVAKILLRTHIVLMRADNSTVALLRRVRGNGHSSTGVNGMTMREGELQKSEVPEIVSLSLSKPSQIREIRPRKSDSSSDSQIA